MRVTLVFFIVLTSLSVSFGHLLVNGCAAREPLREDDFIIRNVQEAIDQLSKEFEICDKVESQLIFLESIKKVKRPDLGKTVSIVIFRPSCSGRITKSYKKSFDERLHLRFTRVISDNVSSPIAIISTEVLGKGTSIEETILHYEDEKWHASVKRSP